MSKAVTMEVFRAGKQTDSAGNTKTWTKEDLDKIVKAFKELGEDVPATIGHKVKDKPAFGWFKKIWRKGDTLMADLSDVVDEFGEMLKKKMFKKRSIALRPDFSLRHIAFLGAEPPAVKGLKGFAFSDEDDEFEEYEFTMSDADKNTFRIEGAFRSVGRLFQGFRDKLIEKDGIEKTNEIFPQWAIDNVKELELIKSSNDFSEEEFEEFQQGTTTTQTYILSKDRFKDLAAAKKWMKENNVKAPKVDEKEDSFRFRQKDPGLFDPKSFRTKKISDGVSIVIGKLKKKSFTEPEPNGGQNMDYKEQFEAEQAKNEQLTKDLETAQAEAKDQDGKTFKEKFEAEKKRADDLQNEKETTEKAAKDKEYSDFAESLVKDEKILPAEKGAVIAMQRTLDGQEPIDFTEGDKIEKRTPLEVYKKQFENKSVGGLFGEKFNGNASPREAAETEIKTKTEEIMEKEKCSFGEASKKLRAKEPGLFKDLEFTEPVKDE